MNAQAILAEIRPLGAEGYRKILLNHGAQESCYGVKIADLQKIRKRIKKDYQLALDLFETGVYDAQYLAGLIADDSEMTKKDLRHWLAHASAPIANVTVASVAAGSPHGWELALEWIESKEERIASAGWATLSAVISVKADADLDLPAIRKLLQRAQKTIHKEPDVVRYQMNGFIIAAGCFVGSLTEFAKEVAENIGRVTVDMGNTACEVPFASDYIKKVEDRGTIGKKRKSAKC